MNLIYHIVSQSKFNKLSKIGFYRPESVEKDGFIHCSYLSQVSGIANQLYINEDNLILLEIDKSLTGCKIVDEDLYNLNMQYPHIYGELPISSVITQYSLQKDFNGNYVLPQEIL